MHQQDCLLSCQLHPMFPPAWKEIVELQGSNQVSFAKHSKWFGTKSQLSWLVSPQPIRDFPTIESVMFLRKTISVTSHSI